MTALTAHALRLEYERAVAAHRLATVGRPEHSIGPYVSRASMEAGLVAVQQMIETELDSRRREVLAALKLANFELADLTPRYRVYLHGGLLMEGPLSDAELEHLQADPEITIHVQAASPWHLIPKREAP